MSPTPAASISVRELTKSYGPVAAVRGVSLEVAPGEIFGLLGVNGAGKTTVLECILGLRRPDTGAIALCGRDALAHPTQVRQQVGAQLQMAALQDKITPRQALRLFGSFYREPADLSDLLVRFSLEGKADASFDTLSGGQRQRLFLALAFINRPQILVLDEPTAGLDPQSRRELHRLIEGLKSAGRAILLSTHYLEEAQQLCDRIGILHEGRIIAQGSPASLVAGSRTPPKLTFRTSRPVAAEIIATLPGVVDRQETADGWQVTTGGLGQTINGLVRLLESDRNDLLDLQIKQPSLEDVFIELTGQPWKDSAPEKES